MSCYYEDAYIVAPGPCKGRRIGLCYGQCYGRCHDRSDPLRSDLVDSIYAKRYDEVKKLVECSEATITWIQAEYVETFRPLPLDAEFATRFGALQAQHEEKIQFLRDNAMRIIDTMFAAKIISKFDDLRAQRILHAEEIEFLHGENIHLSEEIQALCAQFTTKIDAIHAQFAIDITAIYTRYAQYLDEFKASHTVFEAEIEALHTVFDARIKAIRARDIAELRVQHNVEFNALRAQHAVVIDALRERYDQSRYAYCEAGTKAICAMYTQHGVEISLLLKKHIRAIGEHRAGVAPSPEIDALYDRLDADIEAHTTQFTAKIHALYHHEVHDESSESSCC